MSISHADFYRILPKALHSYTYQTSPPNIIVDMPDGKLTISLATQTVHKIASLELPSTQIDFMFDNIKKEDIESFFKQFELSFRRGGG